jgi:hypothetical protein
MKIMKTILITLISLPILFLDSYSQVIKITNNPSYLEYFKTSQNDVIWSEKLSTAPDDFHMMFYKGATGVIKDVGLGRANYSNFDIDDGKAVFAGGISSFYGDIMYFNGSSTSVFATGGFNPSMSGDQVAFFAQDFSPGNIRLYTGGSYVTTPTGGGTPWALDLDQDKVVWWDPLPYPGELKIFDGSTVTSVPSSNLYSMKYFQISAGNVIFIGKEYTGIENLFYYDGSTTTQLNTNEIAISQQGSFNGSTTMEGNRVVWLEKPENINQAGSGYEVWYFDGSTKHLLVSSTDSRIFFCTPSISGNNIIWLKKDEMHQSNPFCLGVYNITSSVIKYLNFCPACVAINTMQYIPRLSGNYLTWMHFGSNPYTANIYQADITTLPEVSSSGIYEINASDIILYQDPQNNNISISLSSGNLKDTDVQILNTSGQVVHTETNRSFTAGTKVSIDLGHLPGGLYLLNLLSSGKCITKKFILIK